MQEQSIGVTAVVDDLAAMAGEKLASGDVEDARRILTDRAVYRDGHMTMPEVLAALRPVQS